MNRKEFIINMLIGMLPLFVFIIADEIFGTKVGLIVAVVFGVGELFLTYFQRKYWDKLVVFDTFLLVAMGGISLALDNDIFFKLKPALLELILCVMLGISVFTPANLLLNMSKRYMKDLKISEEQENKMKNSLRIFFYVIVAHTGLIVYAAFAMSKASWAFISGGLFYILMGVYFVAEIVRNKLNRPKSEEIEWLPILDEKGNVTGKAPREHVHNKTFLLHPVVHVHIINSGNQIYLQKRPMYKTVQPGKWDTAVGGHISFDETLEQGLQREIVEEIGIEKLRTILMNQYVWETEIEKELVFMYYAKYDDAINFNASELDDGKFWSFNEIKESIGKNVFTPNFEFEFEIISKTLFKNR